MDIKPLLFARSWTPVSGVVVGSTSLTGRATAPGSALGFPDHLFWTLPSFLTIVLLSLHLLLGCQVATFEGVNFVHTKDFKSIIALGLCVESPSTDTRNSLM